MYSMTQIRRGLLNPGLILREGNRRFHRGLRSLPFKNTGMDIFEEDWDFLLILDACRYDMFEQSHNLPGSLESRRSRASSTVEFLKNNLAKKELLDTVYVTANPQFHRNRDEIETELHDVINIWKEDGWDEEYRTVRPEQVTDDAISASNRYPQKRLIIHYIQPHYPFIGPTGQEYFELDSLDFWDDVRSGNIETSRDILWEAQIENLRIVLPQVRRFLENVEGRHIVTADHGQMFGERAWPIPIREYGHPRGIYTEELVKVPWLVYENGTRREIVSENQAGSKDEISSEVVEQRLENLGYA